MAAAVLLVAAAAALPPVIADPRHGPSAWSIVAGAAQPAPAPGGVVLVLPEGAVDLAWLERAVQLAAEGRLVLSLGPLPPADVVLPYVDGVVVDPPPPAGELAGVASRLAGVPLVVAATDAAGAVAALAGGAAAVLVPDPSPLWAGELVTLLPETLAARGPAGDLATALRGRDLATVVGLPRGFPGGDVGFSSPARVELLTVSRTALAGRRAAGGYLVRVPPLPAGGVLVAMRPVAADAVVASVEVSGEGLPTAAEILARHQRQAARQALLVPRWAADQRLLVRVSIADLGRSFEIVLRGPVFHDGAHGADWEIAESFLDGVRWDLDRFPVLPLLEPRRPPVPPLALRLDEAYRYELRGVETRHGRRCFALRFTGSGDAARGRRWGTAFIDAATFALVAREETAEDLPGEVRSSRSVTEYAPVAGFAAPVSLPVVVVADDLLPAFGGTSTVHRELSLTAIAVRPPGFEAERAAAWSRPHRMLRDAPTGVVPLVPDGHGGRMVGDARRIAQQFLIGGAVWDGGLPFPVPYGGYQLWDFNYRGRGDQVRLLVAGVINDAAVAVRRGGVEVSARAFVQALAFASSPWVAGAEIKDEEIRVRTQRVGVGLAVTPGRTRLQLDVGANYWDFARTDATAAAFVLPPDTLEWTARLEGQLPWGAATFSLAGETGVRQRWSEWGTGGEGPARRTWRRARLAALWEKELAPFARLRLDGEVFAGRNLDRFSAPSPGRFGALRIRGIATGRVQPEAIGVVRASLAMPVSETLRVEAGVDAGWVRDSRSGYHAGPLSGAGVSFTLPGPWGTLVQGGVGYPLATPGTRRPTVELFVLRALGRSGA